MTHATIDWNGWCQGIVGTDSSTSHRPVARDRYQTKKGGVNDGKNPIGILLAICGWTCFILTVI